MIELDKTTRELNEIELDEKEKEELLSYFNYEKKKWGREIKEMKRHLENIEDDYSNIVKIIEYIENDKQKDVTNSVFKYLEHLLFNTRFVNKFDYQSYRERDIELLEKLLEELKNK